MLILAKVALGLGATMAMAGVYVFHEGVIRVDVDERHAGGSHVHFWVPATIVATGMHFMPKDQLNHTTQEMRPFLPALLVDGKLRIDAVSGDGDVVHVSVPARVLRDVADELEEKAPGV
jgi:hypothetical protein